MKKTASVLAFAISALCMAATAHANVKAVTAISDLAGERVLTYSSLDSTAHGGGGGVTIAAIEGSDSITITNFYESDAVVKAKVDISAMTVSIPPQTLYSSSTYGDCSLVAYASGASDRSTEITGNIATDGSITITSQWGIFATDSITDDTEIGTYYNTLIEVPNATLTYTTYNRTSAVLDTVVVDLVAEQSSNVLTIKNFFNTGAKIDILLRNDSTAKIESQYVFTSGGYDYYLYAVTYTSSYLVSKYSSPIICDKASDNRTVSWSNWHNIYTTSSSYLTDNTNMPQTAVVTTEFDIIYPTSTVALSGEGTAASPYLITSAADWNTVAEYISSSGTDFTGQYIQIANDIDFANSEIIPLGYDYAPCFNGDLDGNGKTISGFVYETSKTYDGPLATQTGADACFHDLTVNGSVTSSYNYTGGLIGYLYGKINNVVNKGSVTSSGSYMGGFVGLTADGSSLTDCVNEGTVTASGRYIGGITGQSGAYTTYENCGNKGTVTYTGSTSSSYIGGLVGYAYAGTFTGCYNSGTVSATSDAVGYIAGLLSYLGSTKSYSYTLKGCYNTADISGYTNLGGLICYGTASANVTMDSCYNTGNITSTNVTKSTAGSSGGIAGVYFSGGTYTNCYNTGNITSGMSYYTGGLFGRNRTTDEDDDIVNITISNCYNTGDINCSTQLAGGLFGYLYKYVTVTDCYNTGDVTAGTTYAGGIVGSMVGGGYTALKNCWNSGNVTTGTTYAGGIVGSNAGTDTISCCFNTGNVTATTNYAGGIAGLTRSTVTDVYNAGDVAGTLYVGGLVGCTYKAKTSITRGYSTGSLTPSGATYGNIIGTGTGNTSYWTTGNTMTGTYYLNANAVESTDTASVGLSYAELAKLDLGDNWTAGDNYTYPRITTIADNDYAKAHAAAVIPADGDSYSSITTNFNVGTPDGVTWTASSGSVEIDGNNVTFSESFSGTLTMTATSGNVSVATELTCNVSLSGISDITDASLDVVSEKFYTVSGVEAAEPTDDTKAIYIVVRTYSDGSTTTAKEIH